MGRAKEVPKEVPSATRQLVKNRDDWRCVRCGSTRDLELQHRRSRSIRDEHTHSPANLLALCRTDHAWVHANPREAMEAGLIVSRFVEDPGEVPVKTWRGLVIHDADGGRRSVLP